MEKWEYNSPYIYWDKDKQKWIPSADAGIAPSATFRDLLNAYGNQGWELVNVIGEHWSAAGGHPLEGYGGNVDGFRAFFKRRKP